MMNPAALTPRTSPEPLCSPHATTEAESKQEMGPGASSHSVKISPQPGLKRSSKAEADLRLHYSRAGHEPANPKAADATSAEKAHPIPSSSSKGEVQETHHWRATLDPEAADFLENSDDEGEHLATAFSPSPHLSGGDFSIVPTHNNAQQDSQKKLMTAAKEYLAPFRTVTKTNRALPLLLAPDATPTDIITAVLKHYSGMVVGENHEDVSSKRFLIDNMAALQKAGVSHLFLEHVLSDVHQTELTQYHDSSADQPLPKALAAYLNTLDDGHMNALFTGEENSDKSNAELAPSTSTEVTDFITVPENAELTEAYTQLKQQYNFTKLVEAAKNAQIRVVAFDTEAGYALHKGGPDGTDASAVRRYETMNYLAASKIAEVMSTYPDTAPKKWIAFVGNAHANTYKKVPGLAELTGTVAVAVDDAESQDGYLVRTNVSAYPNEELDLNIDVVVSMPIVDKKQVTASNTDPIFANSDSRTSVVPMASG